IKIPGVLQGATDANRTNREHHKCSGDVLQLELRVGQWYRRAVSSRRPSRARWRSQKSSGRIGTRVPSGARGAGGARMTRQSACANGASSELSWERTGVTTLRPSDPVAVVARM